MLKPKINLYLGLLIFISYAYFYHGASWNQNARLNSIYSVVEFGTLAIDYFMLDPKNNINTGDWSYFNHHYYSKKAPGTTILGVPIYSLLIFVEKILNIDPLSNQAISWNAYLLNLFISVLPLVLGLLAFKESLEILGYNQVRSMQCVLLLTFASMLFPYSSQLWGLTTAAAFIMLGLRCLLKRENKLAGFMLGLAVLCEYMAAVPAVLFHIFPPNNNPKTRLDIFYGASIPACFLLYFNYTLFGSLTSIPVMHTNPAFIDNDLFGGLFQNFRWLAFYGITFDLHRGLFIYSPILLLAFIGFFAMKNKTILKHLHIIALLNIIILLLINSCFNGWHGGATALARYQIIALPFWFLLIAAVSGNITNLLLVILGVYSFFNMLVITAIGPIVPDLHPNPVFDLLYPEFFKGNFAFREFPHRLQDLSTYSAGAQNQTAWLLGHKLGLKSYFALLPLLILWLIFAIFLIFERRRQNKLPTPLT